MRWRLFIKATNNVSLALSYIGKVFCMEFATGLNVLSLLTHISKSCFSRVLKSLFREKKYEDGAHLPTQIGSTPSQEPLPWQSLLADPMSLKPGLQL